MIKDFAESYFYISLPDQFFLLRDGLLCAKRNIKEKSNHNTRFVFRNASSDDKVFLSEDDFSLENISFGAVYEILFREESWSRPYEIDYEWLIEKVLLDLYHELDFCIGFSMTRYQKKMFFHWDRLVLYTTKRDLGLLSRLNRREIVSVPSWKRSPGKGMFFET